MFCRHFVLEPLKYLSIFDQSEKQVDSKFILEQFRICKFDL